MSQLAIARASIIIGQGKITLGSYISQAETDFVLKITPKFTDITRSGIVIGQRWVYNEATLTFTGDGRLPAALITAINAFSNMAGGTEIFGSGDTACLISGADGETIQIEAAAFMPQFTLIGHPEKAYVGPLTVKGIIANTKNYADASSFVTVGTGATFADSAFTTAAILRQTYTCALAGVTGLTAFEFQEGWTLNIAGKADPVPVQGTPRGYRFTGMEVTLEGIPVQPTTAQRHTGGKVSGTGAVSGREEAANAQALTIVGDVTGTTHVTIPLASIQDQDSVFSNIKLRNGNMKLRASRPHAAGVPTAWYTVA